LQSLRTKSIVRAVIRLNLLFVAMIALAATSAAAGIESPPEIVHFTGESGTLGGELFKPEGPGPFPAILYNHGSAPGMLNSQASKVLGPMFAAHGWIFFMPYRRGQGLSSEAGRYIGDEIADARKSGGLAAAAATMTRLLGTEQLQDQKAALQWLKSQAFVQPGRIAAAGNSFGGVEVVLGASTLDYCAAVDASGGAESWKLAPELQATMKDAVRNAKAPLFFFQASNDFDIGPSEALSDEMKKAGKESEMKIYPAFGKSDAEGHSFAYMGASVWFADVLSFIDRHCRQ
jgi:dipeptidyl aminopeptidase/acylaminoacyl peptidase